MLTERERIGKLEAEMVEVRATLQLTGAFIVNALQAVCDQMVDEQLLPAATRTTEIFGRLRKEIDIIRGADEGLARGARAALPHYPTKADQARTIEFHARLRQDEERVRKERLSLRQSEADARPEPEEPRS